MSTKTDNLEKARLAKKIKSSKLKKVLTREEQMNEDLKQITLDENISKKLFGDIDTLSNFENELNKIGDAIILPSRASSNGLNYFRIIFSSHKFSKYQNYSRKDVYKKGLMVSKSLKKNG